MLFLCFKILQSREASVGWFIFAICTVSNDFYIGSVHSHFLFSLCLFGKALLLGNSHKVAMANLPFKATTLVWILGIIVVTVFDHSDNFGQKVMTIVRESINSILILASSLVILKVQGCGKMNKFISASLSVIAVFAVIQWIFGFDLSHNLSMTFFPSNESTTLSEWNDRMESQRLGYSRMRINSLVGFSFDYGYYSGILGLFMLYQYLLRRKISLLAASIILGIGGALLSGSRSTILAVFAGYSLLILLYSNFKVHRLIIPAAIGVVILYFISDLSIVQGTVSAFTDSSGSEFSGSSRDMRLDQLTASLYWFSQSPIVGNGYRFIQNTTEYNDMIARLLGVESLLFDVLISAGLVGFIYWGTFFVQLFREIRQHLHYMQYRLATAVILSFLTFAIATGAQGSMFMTFPILAYCFISPTTTYNKIQK